MDKKVVRKEIIGLRDQMSKEEHREKSARIKDLLFSLDSFKEAKNIFLFISFGSEIDTHPIIEDALKMGKHIGVPVTDNKTKTMRVSRIKDFNKDLEIGNYNILEPRKESYDFMDPNEIDLILVPGLAFDREGYRVGYGGGFYDRFFSKITGDTKKIGLFFDLQEIQKCPINEFDIPLDYIISESGLKKID